MPQQFLRIIIEGATSRVAHECAKLWIQQRHDVILLGRDPQKLGEIHADCLARVKRSGQIIGKISFDAMDIASHEAVLEQSLALLGGAFDRALIAHGKLFAPQSPQDVFDAIALNGASACAFAFALSRKARAGTAIGAISSIAAIRGRAQNTAYGAGKSALSLYMEGLDASLAPLGARAIDIRLGFVDTPMGASAKQSPLLRSAPDAAALIARAMENARGRIYLPSFWLPISWAVSLAPAFLWRKAKG